ncbi:MAG TPA: hypothetical protein VF135_04680 [Terriglobales bacterium]
MRRGIGVLALVLGASAWVCGQQQAQASGHYMFAWTGDVSQKGNDFLAVIDADPKSAKYGQLVASVETDQKTAMVHHTEYVMPASGMLFANDHYAGRTFILDVRDALHPKVAGSFTGMDGYMHPHSYARLPNGHVLATFQHAHHEMHDGLLGRTGGLVEIDDTGKVIRSASSADPAFPGALLTPYSLVVLPEIDRVLTTNSSMHFEDIFRGSTYQIWRLSDLKLLKTMRLDQGEDRFAQISPEEPRLGPDGAVYVQTLACGIERVTDIASDEPKSQLVYSFPTSFCGVPTIVGHYLIQSIGYLHAVAVLDISNGAKPVEVSRVMFDSEFHPHWTGWDAKTQRLVVTSNGRGANNRIYMLAFDQATGKLAIDEAFHSADGKPGFDVMNREWPHGWKGSGVPHGVVFSR